MAQPINLNQPGHRVIEVTPTQAKKWLLLNKHNRRLKQTKISLYARDMRKGRWQYTGEAIKFNERGELADGQNRLHAVIDSEATVPMLIVTGVPVEAQEVMDQGANRTAGDSLTLRGFKNPNELAAVARIHYLWKRQLVFRHCMVNPSAEWWPTRSDIIDYTEEFPGFADAVLQAKPVARQIRLPIGAIGAVAYEINKIDEVQADYFWDCIAQNKTAGRGDPINTLINRCKDMAMRREILRPSTAIFMLVRSWNAMRTDEKLKSFLFGSEAKGWAVIPDPK